MKKKIAIAALMALAHMSASAGFIDGNKLLDWLQRPEYKNVASVYIQAISDSEDDAALFELANPRKYKVRYFCVPDQVYSTQLSDIVKKYLENNPKNRHWSAAMLSRYALVEAYPCAK